MFMHAYLGVSSIKLRGYEHEKDLIISVLEGIRIKLGMGGFEGETAQGEMILRKLMK